jgi:OOP family OmpA-OmpF porin
MELSKKRANTVKEYLTSRGAAAARLEANGYGKTKPLATNDTAEGRALNRRISLFVIAK